MQHQTFLSSAVQRRLLIWIFLGNGGHHHHAWMELKTTWATTTYIHGDMRQPLSILRFVSAAPGAARIAFATRVGRNPAGVIYGGQAWLNARVQSLGDFLNGNFEWVTVGHGGSRWVRNYVLKIGPWTLDSGFDLVSGDSSNPHSSWPRFDEYRVQNVDFRSISQFLHMGLPHGTTF